MRRRPRLGYAVTAITVLGLVGALCVLHADDVGSALGSVPPLAMAGAVALHVATLGLRSEAWRLTLAAAGGDSLSRPVVHGANAAAFVAGTLQSQAALPARVALLRRLAGGRAPRAGQIYVADVPIFALELCATSLLLIAAVLTGRGPWWVAPGAFALALAVLLGARLAPERFAHRPIVRGLAILGDRRRRGALVLLVAGIAALTVARVWLILALCGLPHGLDEIAWVFAALGIFGVLPLGPGAPPGATLAAIGAASVGAAVAAGLLLSASWIVAVLVYALGIAVAPRLGPLRRSHRRRRHTVAADELEDAAVLA
ncbi:hypothetical protein BH20ACT17_BH20ACT17_17980 [soil metagenome]